MIYTMKVLQRSISPVALQLYAQYPILTITGPRQSGKTTLVQTLFPQKPYVNFEKPDTREFFESDPNGFLASYPDGAIFDEIQRVPQLSSYLQVLVDHLQRNSMFILTGSAQFEMLTQINQSLAGRTALLRLLPFSVGELGSFASHNLDTLLYTGFYPRIYHDKLNATQFYADYLQTYIERDVRQLIEIKNLSLFQRFIRLCAGRVGQLLNLESLGNDTGVSSVTVRHWLSVLEASYVIMLLPPWFENNGKRLIKSPKLYFYDIGLASYLCGIEGEAHAASHPLRGNLFENMVIIEALKCRYNQGKQGSLHFYRDAKGMEVDLLYPDGPHFIPVEIKSAQTIHTSFYDTLTKIKSLFPERHSRSLLVYGGKEEQNRTEGKAVPWFSFTKELM